jgi:hypothetical protein
VLKLPNVITPEAIVVLVALFDEAISYAVLVDVSGPGLEAVGFNVLWLLAGKTSWNTVVTWPMEASGAARINPSPASAKARTGNEDSLLLWWIII